MLLVVAATSALGWAIVDEVGESIAQRARDEIETVTVSLRAASRAQIARVEAGKAPTPYRAFRSEGLPNPAGLSARLSLRGTELPLPVAGSLPSGIALPTDLSRWAGGPARRVSSDDGDRWVAVRYIRGGALLIVAVDTRFGDELVESVVRAVVVVGGTVVVVAAAAAWVLVRRELRPLESLARVADEIAAGDLDQRAAATRSSSEVGRVSASVNRMVDALARAVEVEEANRVRAERFATDAAHELRTPTTAILGYAQLGATQGPWSETRATEMWDAVEQQATRLRDLVEQLLEVQRLADAEIALPASEWFDLASLVTSIARDSRVIDPSHPVDARAPDACWVDAPRAPIAQVVSNLVANVRAHTPPGTHALIEAIVAPDGVELIVSDDGPGIPVRHRDEVFDRLARVPGTTAPGSGLGLAIVAAIVDRLGGRVAVEDVASDPDAPTAISDAGTTIRVVLPFIAQSSPPDREPTGD